MGYSDKQKIAIHFYETTGLKSTKQTFINTMSQANSLLNAGYTLDDICRTIDYLKNNPPAKGFFSLGLVQYRINEVLQELKVNDIKEAEKEKVKTFLDSQPKEENNSNKDKYKNQQTNITRLFKR